MSEELNLPHTCPNCNNVTATNEQELENIFGKRKKPEGTRNQSWCKKCRKDSLKK
jgi:hypothetical protein